MKNVAHVTGKDWLGSLPEPGPTFYVGAEDDEPELHIRLAAVAKHYGVTFRDLIKDGLHIGATFQMRNVVGHVVTFAVTFLLVVVTVGGLASIAVALLQWAAR